jgi:hypothetical protein
MTTNKTNKKQSSNNDEGNLEIHYSIGGFKTAADILEDSKDERKASKEDNEELFIEFLSECNHGILLKELRRLQKKNNDEK